MTAILEKIAFYWTSPFVRYALIVGVLIAFVVSVAAIKFLTGFIKKHSFAVFGWYRIILGAIVLGAFYLLLSIIWKGGMGDGDIKLAFILGLITGWLGWSQFIIGAFAAFFIGGFLSLVLIIGKKVDMHGGIPFGPSMLLGIWLGIFVGAPIATLYLQVTGLA